jgi:GNAT superfamily N-acetyltransferase
MVSIREVVTKRDAMQFIKLPWRVYKGDPYWVAPLIFDMKNTLNRKHPFFEFGEAAFFLAERDGIVIGRIDAHINHNHNKHNNVQEGFFGFFECMNDEEAAQALFAKAEEWCREKGAVRMLGPMNFTIYDEIGILADGFDNEPKLPIILEMYNPKYYVDLLARAGYAKDIDWLSFLVTKDVCIPEIVVKVKQRLISKGFVFRCISMKNIEQEVEAVKDVINTAWSDNWGHVNYTDAQFAAIVKALKLIVDPRFVFVVEKDGQAIACSITLPNINPSLKKMNGRFLPFGWWHFLRSKKKAHGLRTFLFGVRQEYRNRGIDAVLIMDTIDNARAVGHQWSSCSIIVENNIKMIQPVLDWGGKEIKRYRIFTKQL